MHFSGIPIFEEDAVKRSVVSNAITTLVVALFLLPCIQIYAQTGVYVQREVGSKYGSLGPLTCQSKREPVRGAPTPRQAAIYVACEQEGEKTICGGCLVLLRFQNIEVGKARPFNRLNDRMSDADVDSPIYPIRGSYGMYFCYEPDPPFFQYPKGRNCNLAVYPRAEGDCYRTTFGDWSCSMYDSSSQVQMVQNVPPPR